MEPGKDVDAWADALLDQHRTMPRAEVRRMQEPAPLEDIPPIVRLSMHFGGDHPTRDQVERMNKAARRRNWIAVFDNPIEVITIGAVLVFIFFINTGF